MPSQSLIEELKAWKVEANFNLAREAAFWAHKFGEIVRSYHQGELTEPIVQNLTREIGKSRATIFRWVELYDKDNDFDHLISQHGKNISITTLLGEGKKEKPVKEMNCKHCPLHCS